MRAVDLLSRVRESAGPAWLRDRREWRRRVPWPEQAGSSDRGDRVAIVVVNHDTRALIAQLVFSLYRVLGADRFATVVVVDNASRDGSRETLRALADAGLIQLIANDRQRYHGSGLNQALSWLAARQARVAPSERVDYVWALDSDTVILRREAIDDALAAFTATGAAAIGESFGPRDGYEHLALCTLMLDPRRAWRPELSPFRDDGVPDQRLLESVADRGGALEPFPFLHGSYVLHLGSGTLIEVARGADRRQRYYGWASRHHERGGFTYTSHPLGAQLHAALLAAYAEEVPGDTPQALVAACRRTDLITIPQARPLPPREELQRQFDAGADLAAFVLAQQEAPAPSADGADGSKAGQDRP